VRRASVRHFCWLVAVTAVNVRNERFLETARDVQEQRIPLRPAGISRSAELNDDGAKRPSS
jgi:hypothetical protein